MRITHKVAVKAMVTRVLRSGDLRVEFSGARRAREGIRIHRRIQKSRPDTYTAEVPVRLAMAHGAIDLQVSGRIDGVFTDTHGSTVEEIKTTALDLDKIAGNPDPVHLGQAHCYAYMYAAENDLARVTVQLTYYQVESRQTKSWSRTVPLDELERRFHEIAGQYLAQIEAYLDWQACRNASIESLDFPFAGYRAGQREMAVGVYRTIRDGGQLLVQAATGIGKTLGTLFPAVKSLPGVEGRAILYLTARTTGRLAALKAFEVMRGGGLRLKTLTITAKDKICFQDERSCNPEDCEFAKGYFDRVGGAMQAIFDADDFSRERIAETARVFRVCPFEFSLELVFYADCVVCDYNYAFDPRVSLKRLFAQADRSYIYLVDEAHNLVDRAREMYSAQLEKQDVLALRRKAGKQVAGLFKSLGKVNAWMVKMRKQCQALPEGTFSQSKAPGELTDHLLSFIRRAEKWLLENPKGSLREDVLSFYFTAANFVKTAERFGAEYVTLFEQTGANLRVKLFCLDPAGALKAARENSAAAVFFSGTMTPFDYFRRLFGCPGDAAAVRIGSPFPGDRLGLFVADRVSTLFHHRAHTLDAVTEMLLALVARKKGNYLFFFPSYDYLSMVHRAVIKARPALSTLVQKREMGHAEKDAFLKQFRKNPTDILAGFAVLGGIFGEGIDLAGDQLSGAAVIGVGLPAISYENELIKGYFNRVEGTGYQYAYQYPGINRVLQGAGRVIRAAEDRGVVLLVDQRYSRFSYRALLPPHWRPAKVADAPSLYAVLKEFWQAEKKAKSPGALRSEIP